MDQATIESYNLAITAVADTLDKLSKKGYSSATILEILAAMIATAATHMDMPKEEFLALMTQMFNAAQEDHGKQIKQH